MNLGDIMLYIWLGVIAALILVEIISRNLTGACFGISAIASAICTHFSDNYLLQVGIFLIFGIFLIVFVRPNILEIIKNKKETVKKNVKEETVKKDSEKVVNKSQKNNKNKAKK